MWFESWIRMNCSRCSASNWLYAGHSDDELYQLADGIKCWDCEHTWTLPEWDEMYNYDPEEDLENDGPPEPYYVLGIRMEEKK